MAEPPDRQRLEVVQRCGCAFIAQQTRSGAAPDRRDDLEVYDVRRVKKRIVVDPSTREDPGVPVFGNRSEEDGRV